MECDKLVPSQNNLGEATGDWIQISAKLKEQSTEEEQSRVLMKSEGKWWHMLQASSISPVQDLSNLSLVIPPLSLKSVKGPMLGIDTPRAGD